MESFPEFIAFAAGTFRDPKVALQAARHCYTWKKALRVVLCNLYSITTNQAAMIALVRVINNYIGNLRTLPAALPLGSPIICTKGGSRANDW